MSDLSTMLSSPENHRFFSSHRALQSVSAALTSGHLIRIATAFFAPSGYQYLQDILAGKELMLLVGREEGGRDKVEEVISEFVDQLAAHPLERRTHAMRQMLDALERNMLVVAVSTDGSDPTLIDARYLYQHAKLYIADKDVAIVTSANMSYHGLVTSREAGIEVIDKDDVLFFVQQFDYYFDKAEPITEPLIEKLRAYLAQHMPFDVYVRALLALYGLPDDNVPAELPELAAYQRPVVSRVLRSLVELKGSLLIASTGLGKTVMGAHIVAYLRMEQRIDRVLVVCPAGLRDTWERYMRMAATSSAQFSYHALSNDDPKRNQIVRKLEYELRNISPRTLIILDESHHMRNADDLEGEQRLRYERVSRAVHQNGAHLLMLTATPFSRTIDDVNKQLALIQKSELAAHNHLLKGPIEWRVGHAAELSGLPPCAVLTTPNVVHHFSHADINGDRYVLFSGDQPRYFPRSLRFRTLVYQNPLDEVLVDLLDSSLLNQQDGRKSTSQPTLWGNDEMTGKKAGFFNAEVMRQFCSSPFQVADLFTKLEQPGGFQKMRFAHQDDLTAFVDLHQHIVKQSQQPTNDEKLTALLDIISQSKDEKIVIFCHYRETAKAIADLIPKFVNGIHAETTADKDVETVAGLLKRFAPVANDVPSEERELDDPIHVLIATGALAEGFNLQDASVLINFDLPWTVLVLAQRMGRILRPWHEPREVTIYNLIPSTMSNTDVQMAMNWHKRLVERNRQHRAFADIPVMLDQRSQDEGFEMASLAQQLQHNEDIELNLDQVLDFIRKVEQYGSSSFLDDLAILTPEDHQRVLGLPFGFRSVRQSNDDKDRLFILFEHRRQYHPVLFDRKGRVVMTSEQSDEIMNIIRCERETPLIVPSLYPDDDELDAWIERARTRWIDERGWTTTNTNIVCVMALISVPN